MQKRHLVALAAAVLLGALTYCLWRIGPAPRVRLQGVPEPISSAPVGHIEIAYPYDKSIFPPEAIAPRFSWQSNVTGIERWVLRVEFGSGEVMKVETDSRDWTPEPEAWSSIKRHSTERPATLTIQGIAGNGGMGLAAGTSTRNSWVTQAPAVALAVGRVTFQTSRDRVDSPIFYREVTLPFIQAVKDPAQIRWRFGSIDSPSRPPVVLENLPVCGNCHSFSRDGRVLGMDVDYANDKGSYTLLETGHRMILSREKLITWSDFRREDKELTFGLLSQVSPDGRYAVSTVKDRSVFVPKPDLEFSQLFFPLKGILAVYDRERRTFSALPGADDPSFVHSNPTWSPDGKFLVFARSRAHELKTLRETDNALLTPEECKEFLSEGKIFRYDLYRIPFNAGRGGKAAPLKGASNNQRSNFFAKYSPDGRWIVFCQANSFMLLQPDSELYIIPSEGGEARKLECNTNRMNSWHSFSPNGRWLVFSSKAQSPFTQLYLAHLDAEGHSAPPIALSHFTSTSRAANIPEFVDLRPDAIAEIDPDFVDDISYMRTALENLKANDRDSAERLYRKAIELNPKNAEAHAFLGGLLTDRGALREAREHLLRSIQLLPRNGDAYYNLGNIAAKERDLETAIANYQQATRLDPRNARAHQNLGSVLLALDQNEAARRALTIALRLDTENAHGHRLMGNALNKLEQPDEAEREWLRALQLDPNLTEARASLALAQLKAGNLDLAIESLHLALRSSPDDLNLLLNLGQAYALKGDFANAAATTTRAASVATNRGQSDMLDECQRRLASYARRQH